MQADSRNPEILTASHFYLGLSLKGFKEPVDAVFQECQGFKTTQEVIEVCEVTPQKWGQKNQPGRVVRTKVPGNVKTTNLILRRGTTNSMTLWNWFKAVQDGRWSLNKGEERRDGSLTIYDQSGAIQALFEFSRAWPSSYKVSDLSAKSTEFNIEELELAIEELIRKQ